MNTATGGQLGYSVAGGTNIFGDGHGDIILGAPNATFGATSGTGAVYALSTGVAQRRDPDDQCRDVGQSGSQSAIFTGASSARRPAGASPTAATSTA